MSYGFAGALQGVGNALQQWSAEKRAEAQRLLEMEQREKMARERMVFAQELKGRGRAGGGGRRGGGGGRKGAMDVGGFGGAAKGDRGRALSPRERDDLSRYYKSAFPDDDIAGTPKPTLAEFEAHVETMIGSEPSLGAAAKRAASEWSVEEVSRDVEKPRATLSPARIFGDKTYTETETEFVGGFGGRTPPAAPAAPAPAKAPAGGGDAAILEEARRAIAAGADRSAVIARLRENGIEPKGL